MLIYYPIILLEPVLIEAFNPDLDTIVTPLDVEAYHKLLKESKFDEQKSEILIDGFTNGFDLGYRGPRNIKLEAKNLKLRVGSKLDLWNKIMKEVKEGRFAGGFRQPPFRFYIQSPLGKWGLNYNIKSTADHKGVYTSNINWLNFRISS